MDKARLSTIIERVADNTATDEELSIYNAWCNAMQAQDRLPGTADLRQAEADTLHNIQQHIGKRRRFSLPLRYAAAAMLAGALAAGFFIYRQAGTGAPDAATPPAVAGTPADVPAGRNSATLILANGSKVVLADVANGRLADEAGAQVTKTAAGTLEYRPSGADAPSRNNTLQTARGEQFRITLSDGTVVWLNAATTLTFPASFADTGARRVTVAGEAYFDVARNAAQPFIVQTAGQEIAVLGTSFNVNSYADEPTVRTTLLQGVVRINNQQTIKPNQQAVSDRSGALRIVTVDGNAIAAWKNGYFEFNDENIYEIMRRIARWYDVEVIYEGDIPLNGMEGTISRFENVSKVLGTIEKTGLLKFRVVQRKIYVSKY